MKNLSWEFMSLTMAVVISGQLFSTFHTHRTRQLKKETACQRCHGLAANKVVNLVNLDGVVFL